jgi:hypothetical protein
MGFGDFMSGMQGGMSTMDDLKNSRLKRKLYDQALTEGEALLDAKDFDRNKQGLPLLDRMDSSDTLLGKLSDKLDPVLSRWMEKLGRGTGTTESPDAAALPTSEEQVSLSGDYNVAAPELDPSQFEAPEVALADGGLPDQWEFTEESSQKPKSRSGREPYSVDSKEEIERRAKNARTPQASRQAIPEQVVDRSGDKTLAQRAKGAAGKAAKYEGYGLNIRAPEGAGMLRRGANAAARVGGRAVATAGILGAASGGVRGALDTETTGDGFWSDIGQRAVGAGKGALAGALDPLGEYGRWTSDGDEAPPEAVPTAAPTPPAGKSRRGGAPMAGSRQLPAVAAAPAAAPQAVPTAAAEADPLAGFDVSKIPSEKIPNFSNNDWIAHRKDMMDSLIMHGMSYAEAWDKVDQQVVATQQRGFMHFGNQARQLLATGDVKGAASAVRAAFQYMPSTTDLQVGEYNGNLVAFSVDEDTGEQVGRPVVINDKMLNDILMNFADRNNWAQYAQDNRKLDQADTELKQGERRLDLMEEGLGIERENALTKRIDAIGGGLGGTVLKEPDIATARRQLNDWAYALGGGEDADPALPAALTALAEAEYKRRGGDLSTIVMRLEEMMRSPGGPDTILAAARRLASGQ